MALHLNEFGVDLDVSVGETLAGMSSAIFNVKKPGGTEVEWSASVQGDEGDGVLRYQIADGDLDEVGIWKLHAIVTFAGPKELIGDKTTFEVLAIFNDD